MAKFNQRCFKCKKNFVPVSRIERYVMCYDCQKTELHAKIKDPKMKKMFDIPEEFYKESAFLRSIKINYIRYGELSTAQIDTFKKVVKELKAKLKKSK
ncbi:MAG: hypothetical protein L6408_03315 [Nanoarchaeota archaeon]|nr:hypothetical protein [Nanoarchaeota archaeon]